MQAAFLKLQEDLQFLREKAEAAFEKAEKAKEASSVPAVLSVGIQQCTRAQQRLSLSWVLNFTCVCASSEPMPLSLSADIHLKNCLLFALLSPALWKERPWLH